MRPEVKELLQTGLYLLIGALLPYLRTLVKSRESQGKRVGSVEDRLAYIEGRLGIRNADESKH